MNLKRSLTTIMLGAAITIGGHFATTSTAYAEDVWAYSSEWGDDYVMTETITKERDKQFNFVDIKFNVKQVNKGKVSIQPIIFRNGNIIARTGTGMRNVGRIEDSPYGRALWKVVKQYL